MSTTLTSTAPLSVAAILGFIKAAAAAVTPTPIPVYPAELLQYEPGAYIIVDTNIYDHSWNIEAYGYEFIEEYAVHGICTVFNGANDPDTISLVMTQTYALYTDLVMLPIVTNRGGANIPVLGISGNPHPYEVKPGFAQYVGNPGNIGGGQGGWVGRITWSFNLKAYIAPA